MQTDELLDERENTHGLFHETSASAQAIKEVMREARNWDVLLPIQREALDMIANKMSRACNGDPGFADHWLDIAGYAVLVARQLAPQTQCSCKVKA